MNSKVKNYITKNIAIFLSISTLLTTTSLYIFAENNFQEKITTYINQIDKKVLASVGAGAIVLGAIVGITAHIVKNSHIELINVDRLKDKHRDLYNQYDELYKAIVNYDDKKVEEIFKNNPLLNANAQFNDGKTLLTLACDKFFYLNLRPNVNNSKKEAFFKIFELLIKNGAEVNVIENDDKLGYSPLHYAAKSGSTKLCELLLKNGAKIDFKDKNGHTPLRLAINLYDYFKNQNEKANQFFQTCKLLIERKSDVNIKDKWGKTPLECIQENENLKKLINK